MRPLATERGWYLCRDASYGATFQGYRFAQPLATCCEASGFGCDSVPSVVKASSPPPVWLNLPVGATDPPVRATHHWPCAAHPVRLGPERRALPGRISTSEPQCPEAEGFPSQLAR